MNELVVMYARIKITLKNPGTYVRANITHKKVPFLICCKYLSEVYSLASHEAIRGQKSMKELPVLRILSKFSKHMYEVIFLTAQHFSSAVPQLPPGTIF